jgi:hypothetical protein
VRRLRKSLDGAVAAASSLTGTRFNLLVASSLVATAAIVASGLTGAGDNGALAALLGQQPAETAAAENPAAHPSPASAGSSGASAAPEAASSASSVPLTPAEPSATPTSEPPPTKQPDSPVESLPEAGRIKHVFVMSLASSGYDAAFGSAPQMPYLAGTLRPEGELLSGYSLLGEAALPNQIAAISGQPPNPQTKQNCPEFEECLFPVETATLADQLTAGRFKWHGYIEGMVDETGKPDTCVQPGPEGADESPSGGYAARSNPFVYFHSLLDLGDCALNDVPLDRLDADLRNIDSTPNYALISPNLCNAGVTGQCPEGTPDGAASADAFLSQWVSKILDSPAFEKDGLLIIAFGEINPPDPMTAAPPAGKPKVGALLLSRFVSPGATDPAAYDPYSLLRTIEDLFGLDHLAEADGAKVKSLAPGLLGETRGD